MTWVRYDEGEGWRKGRAVFAKLVGKNGEKRNPGGKGGLGAENQPQLPFRAAGTASFPVFY